MKYPIIDHIYPDHSFIEHPHILICLVPYLDHLGRLKLAELDSSSFILMDLSTPDDQKL